MGMRTSFSGVTNANGTTLTTENNAFLSPYSQDRTFAKEIQIINTGAPSLLVTFDEGQSFVTVPPSSAGVPMVFKGIFRSLSIKSATAVAGAYSGSMELAA